MTQTDGWSGFLLYYLLTAVVVTALLVAICPRLDLSGIEPPPAVQAFIARLDASPAVQSAARSVRNGFGWRYHPAPPPAAPPPTETNGAPPPETARPWFRPEAAEPAEQPAPAPSSGVKPVQMWGVVIRPSARVYNRSGKFVQQVKAGTVLDITEIWKTKSGDLILCEAITENRTLPDALVRMRDVDARQGPLVKVPVREKDLRCELAELLAAREDLQSRRKPAPRPDNPHFAAYTQARQAYSNFWARVQALEAGRENATGAQRSKCIDDLARIKISEEDVKVGKALEAAKARYGEWNAANPAPAGEPDEKADELTLKINALRFQIEGLQHQP
jgi:hypothetical protein